MNMGKNYSEQQKGIPILNRTLKKLARPCRVCWQSEKTAITLKKSSVSVPAVAPRSPHPVPRPASPYTWSRGMVICMDC